MNSRKHKKKIIRWLSSHTQEEDISKNQMRMSRFVLKLLRRAERRRHNVTACVKMHLYWCAQTHKYFLDDWHEHIANENIQLGDSAVPSAVSSVY